MPEDPDPDPVEDPKPDPKDEPFDEERAKAKIAKANSEAASLRKRLKELEAKAAKLDELENAGKSESERLTAAVADAERKAQEAEARVLRLEIASDKGLSAAQAKRLVGNTREELEADADELLESFPASNGGGSKPTTRPREQLRGGAEPDDEGDPNVADIVKNIPRL